MQSKTESGVFYSWKTEKLAASNFAFVITKNTTRTTPTAAGSYCDTEIVKCGAGLRSRAQARTRAHQWLRYLAAS